MRKTLILMISLFLFFIGFLFMVSIRAVVWKTKMVICASFYPGPQVYRFRDGKPTKSHWRAAKKSKEEGEEEEGGGGGEERGWRGERG